MTQESNKFAILMRTMIGDRYSNLIATALLGVGLATFCFGCSLLSPHGLWGYINPRGDWVIPPTFREPPGQFHSGIAPVLMNGRWCFIDRKGNPIQALSALSYTREPHTIDEGLILAHDGQYSYIDITGKKVILADFKNGGDFHEGLAPVQFLKGPKDKYCMWGYIDKSGKPVIGPRFSWAFEFSNGLAIVEVGAHNVSEPCTHRAHFKKEPHDHWEHGNYGFIDKSGNFVIEPSFERARVFTDSGLAAVQGKVGGWKYIDRRGNIVIPAQYSDAGDFVDGVAPVCHNGKWGFIDTSGNWVDSPKYDFAKSFSEGLAAVGTDTGRFEDEVSREWPIHKYGFINRQFKLVIPESFLGVRPFSEGLAAAAAK